MSAKHVTLRYRGKDPLRQRLAALYERRNTLDELIRGLERYRRYLKAPEAEPENLMRA